MSERLDSCLVSRGLAASRERAKTLIRDGKVSVNGRTVTKPAFAVGETDEITAESDLAFVGRGALKLEKAVETFSLDPGGCVCADIGASTGGFTEVLLNRGAAKVYAVDVGHGQLSEKLKADPRVVNMEGRNARELDRTSFPEPVSFISIDLSFISLEKVMPAVSDFAADQADAAVLIKPQFEAGRAALNKQGVVTDRKTHITVLRRLVGVFEQYGFSVRGLTFSPVRGGSGNVEYLAHLIKASAPSADLDIKRIVNEAFDSL